jgi:hemerythrin
MEKTRVANGIFWVEIPEADLRVLCGCPADSVKHLIARGLIAPVRRGGVTFETGPNAILLSDTPVQRGSFANLAEFPLLQMFYRQGLIIPGHPNNTGRKPLLIGLGDQVRAQAAYVFRGNYGLRSLEEIQASGVPREAAREMWAVKKWFAFGSIKDTEELVEIRAMDADAVELRQGIVVHRKGFNVYEFLGPSDSVEVDLTLGPGEEYQPAYSLPPRTVRREPFSIIHVGEGDGWDASRPSMSSIVCCDGLLYVVDAGPHVTHSLDALGLGIADIEGIFHTHAHDDHFAGLTSLVRSERRLKYFSVPYVRSSVQKKMSALMRIDEQQFESFFEVHDLRPGQWNRVGALEVKPVYSPHPVETTVFLFHCGAGDARKTYAHLADIPSFDVLARLAAPGKDGPAFPEPSRAEFIGELTAPADVKKIDVGGGLIHGASADFAADSSKRILLSHGASSIPSGFPRAASIAAFGETDVLIPGDATEYRLRTARSCLSSWFPGCSAGEIDALALCPMVEIPSGRAVHVPDAPSGDTRARSDADVRMILSGIAEESEAGSGATRRLTVGAFAAGYPWHERESSACRAMSDVTVLSIPPQTYRDFISRAVCASAFRLSSANRDRLLLCPLFARIQSEKTLNGIASSLSMRALGKGGVAPAEREPLLFLLIEGAMDLAVGEQLLESIGPGGSWGEERIVTTAPALTTAYAVTDCAYAAIPAAVLAGIPIVQWELHEAFEKRLRRFRAGFRFEWSEFYRVNVREMDDQHKALFSLVNELSERVGKTGTITGHDGLKAKVLENAREHFLSEESLMERNAYPRLAAQRAEHADLLERLRLFLGAEEHRTRPRAESMVGYLKDWLIRHTLMEDLKYRDFFAEKGIR